MSEQTEKETVVLSDGRKVEFAGKRRMIKSSRVLDDGALAITLDFRNGETRTFVLPQSLRDKFALHGAEQKYGDEVSGVDDVDDMVIAIDELHKRLDQGEWGIKRESSGISGTSVLLKALIESTGKDAAFLKDWLAAKQPAEKTALRKSTKLLPIIQRLEAEKAAGKAKVDENTLFDGL